VNSLLRPQSGESWHPTLATVCAELYAFYAFDSKLVFFAYYVRVYRCTSFRLMYLLFCVFLLPYGVIKNNRPNNN